MGAVFSAEAYSPSIASAPYVLVALGCIGLIVYILFTRGDPFLRMSLLAMTTVGAIFAGGTALLLSCVDAEVGVTIARWALAPVSFIGPALVALLLAIGNRVHHYRLVLALSVLVTLVSAWLCIATDLVVAGVWETPWGVLFMRAGPVMELHLTNLWLWGLVATWLARRGTHRPGEHGLLRQRYRAASIVLGLLAVACLDVLLARKIGVYPMAWLPVMASLGIGYARIVQTDIIRPTGPDVAAMWEVGVLVAVAGAVLISFAVGRRAAPELTVGLVTAVLVTGQLAAALVRRNVGPRSRMEPALVQALDDFLAMAGGLRTECELAAAARALFEDHVGVQSVRLYVSVDGAWCDCDGDGDGDGGEKPRVRIDTRVRAWLTANKEPLIGEQLVLRRLGGLRGPIEALLIELGAEVVLPLVDRDDLIGVLAVGTLLEDRALNDGERVLLSEVQQAVARTVIYQRLYREAEQRIEFEREVEVAAAVQSARAAGRERREIAEREVVSYYRPATQFGGDWWSGAELPDGRLLLAIGDVARGGVPAALVTATVDACCDTAVQLSGSRIDLMGLMGLMNRSVLQVGRGRYVMSCFVGLFDLERNSVTFANAGHPSPYVASSRADNGSHRGLRALMSRGMPLGFQQDPPIAVGEAQLSPGDLVVLYTDAFVEARDAVGRPFGHRGLQRAIRQHAFSRAACDRIYEDAEGHFGRTGPDEDMTLVCVRL